MSHRPAPQSGVRLLALCALLACALATPALARERSALKTAPSFKLPTKDATVSLESLKGSVVYLDFWASWCGPCRASFPWMARIAERHRARGFKVVAVNLDKDRALADAFLAEHPAAFTIAFDPEGRTAGSYGVSVMPSSFLIGRDGTLLLRHAGFDPRRAAELETRIEEALAR